MERDFSKELYIVNAPFLYRGYLGWPSFSPDGSKIAFAIDDRQSNCSINIIDVNDPSNLHSITNPDQIAKRPNWSRQGNQIVYNVDNETIWVFDFDTQTCSLLISEKDRDGRKFLHPCFTPDGMSVIVATYQRGGPQREEILMRITPDVPNFIEEMTQFPHVCAGRMTVSPDNTHVVFAGHAGSFHQAENRLWVKFDGRASYPLEEGNDAECHGRSPSYSPDGKWVACVSARPMVGPSDEEPMSIWIISADGKRSYRLTSNDRRYTHMAWSPDQRKMATICAEGLQLIDLPDIFHS